MVVQVVAPSILIFFNCTIVLFTPVIGQLHVPKVPGNVTVVLTLPLKVEVLFILIEVAVLPNVAISI